MSAVKVSEQFQIAIPEDVRQIVPLRPGQSVELSAHRGVITLIPDSATAPFSLDRIAAAQGVRPFQSLEQLSGRWPEDDPEDGFAETVRRWRDEELEFRR